MFYFLLPLPPPPSVPLCVPLVLLIRFFFSPFFLRLYSSRQLLLFLRLIVNFYITSFIIFLPLSLPPPSSLLPFSHLFLSSSSFLLFVILFFFIIIFSSSFTSCSIFFFLFFPLHLFPFCVPLVLLIRFFLPPLCFSRQLFFFFFLLIAMINTHPSYYHAFYCYFHPSWHSFCFLSLSNPISLSLSNYHNHKLIRLAQFSFSFF